MVPFWDRTSKRGMSQWRVLGWDPLGSGESKNCCWRSLPTDPKTCQREQCGQSEVPSTTYWLVSRHRKLKQPRMTIKKTMTTPASIYIIEIWQGGKWLYIGW